MNEATSLGTEEQNLRVLLQADPYHFEHSRALIAVLLRTGRPPFPDIPIVQGNFDPQDLAGLEELLHSSDEHAHAGETDRVYATIWQACIRYPQTARGWAEFARCLAERREWNNSRTAAERVLNARATDPETAKPLLAALGILAENGQLVSLDWEPWIERLPSELQAHPRVVKIFLCMTEYDRAASLVPLASRLYNDNAETWIEASVAACEAQRPRDAYDHMRRAFELDPAAAVKVMTGDRFSGSFAIIVRTLGKSDELADWITEQSAVHTGLNHVFPSPAPESRLAIQRSRQTAIDRGLPSPLLITQGKSASVSVGAIFSTGFELPTVLYSLSNLRVVLPWLQDYMRGGASYVTHLNPTSRNIELLAAGQVSSVMVLVRDPRQWLISAAAHSVIYSSGVPPEFRESALGGREQMVASAIDRGLPYVIAWIDGWVRARAKLTVNFITFEEFVLDRDRFVDRVLALYAGDSRHFNRKAALQEQSQVDYHRRRGLVDEWKSVLTPRQIEHINSLIPDKFWDLFGWEA